MAGKVLVLVGCGPGMGAATARAFAGHEDFSGIALIARSADKLQGYRTAVLAAAKAAGKNDTGFGCRCWDVDIADSATLLETLKDVEQMGRISCILFNAARVGPSPFFEFEESALLEDFKVTNVGLYTTAKWGIPILQQETERPTPLVTNSLLWQEPLAPLFSLSLVKASQRNMVQSLQQTFKDVHIALLDVAGEVSDDDKVRSPKLIADKFLSLYLEDRASWTQEGADLRLRA